MSKDSKELFQTLLKQIKMPINQENSNYLDNGEINSVKVHQSKKRWDFYFSFEDILPDRKSVV